MVDYPLGNLTFKPTGLVGNVNFFLISYTGCTFVSVYMVVNNCHVLRFITLFIMYIFAPNCKSGSHNSMSPSCLLSAM